MLVIRPTSSINPASISSGTLALNPNPNRLGFQIQNCGTSVLYIGLGSVASSGTYHVALKGTTVNDDGTGAMYSQKEGVVYTGMVSAGGSALRYTVIELGS